MAEIPQEAVQAAAAAIGREHCALRDWDLEAFARAALEAAAPVLEAQARAAERAHLLDEGKTMVPLAELEQLRARVAELEAADSRVRALHPDAREAAPVSGVLCVECAAVAPCATRRALDGPAPQEAL